MDGKALVAFLTVFEIVTVLDAFPNTLRLWDLVQRKFCALKLKLARADAGVIQAAEWSLITHGRA